MVVGEWASVWVLRQRANEDEYAERCNAPIR